MTSTLVRACLLLICLIVLVSGTLAQSQATTGNIEGRVTDPGGAVLTGVTITARNSNTGFVKSSTTDDEGNYRIIVLPPGRYNVTASGAQGFAEAAFENVDVTVGGQTPLNIQLSVAGITTRSMWRLKVRSWKQRAVQLLRP